MDSWTWFDDWLDKWLTLVLKHPFMYLLGCTVVGGVIGVIIARLT